jgi:hypothetical protein
MIVICASPRHLLHPQSSAASTAASEAAAAVAGARTCVLHERG